MILTAAVGAAEAGKRLDDAAKILFPQLSKTQIRRIIDWGGCAVNASMVRVASRPLRQGDEVTLGVMEPEHYVEFVYRREDLIYEDDEYLGINKASGLNSQRTPYQLKGTVEYAVGGYLKSIGITDPVMIAHRLDRGTSGVMIFPKTKRAAAHLSLQLKESAVAKTYWALSSGTLPEDRVTVEACIAKVGKGEYGVAIPGKEATTGFRSLCKTKDFVLLEATPLTGRTHQIRVHLRHIGLPIVGDRTYGGFPAARLMLHCRCMRFTAGDGRVVEVAAPVDEDFRAICTQYGIEAP